MKKTTQLQKLHKGIEPLYVYNCWNEESANYFENRGAQVIATSSLAVAEELGYKDGQQLPFEKLVELAKKLVLQTTLPVTIDCEGLYADNLEQLEKNAIDLFSTGIAGINFEDCIHHSAESKLWSVEAQCERISLVRAVADRFDQEIFINARTDVFFQNQKHSSFLAEQAIERLIAYTQAGADGLFIPGLKDRQLVKKIVENTTLPINILLDLDMVNSDEDWMDMKVGRVSYGPNLYRQDESFLENLQLRIKGS